MAKDPYEATCVARRVGTSVERHPTHLADGYHNAKTGHHSAAPTLAEALDHLRTLADSNGAIATLTAHAAGVVLYHLDRAAPKGYRRG